jgi:predicted DNA-binding transcriptional regulator AlpA
MAHVNRTFPTGRFMRANDLAAKCKIRRSWLNELSRCGKVPGAYQSKSGRWVYPDSPELAEFIRTTRRRSELVRRQQLNVTVAEFERRLRRAKADLKAATDAAKRYPSNKSRALVVRQRAARIKQLNAERESDYLSTRDLADKVSCSQRRISMQALQIPGCERLGGRFIFRKSEEDLSEWIHREVTKRKRQERQRAAKLLNPHEPNFYSFVAKYLTNFQAKWEKQLSRRPLSNWADPELEQVESQLEPIVEDMNGIKAEQSKRQRDLAA